MASLTASLACRPGLDLGFAGDYTAESAHASCSIDHPDALSVITFFLGVDLSIDEDDDGTFSVALPMPPCPIKGTIEGEELRLIGNDCVTELVATASVDEHAIAYTESQGVARWEDDGLMLRMESGRRYLSIPNGLPDWWDDPASCSARYTLQPVE
jgi:hypothetical protein